MWSIAPLGNEIRYRVISMPPCFGGPLRGRVGLLLALPVVELRPGLAEHDPLAGDTARADLAAVEILDDVRCNKGREHEDTDRRVRVVADLVRAFLAARERDHVALAQLPLTLVRAKRGLAAEDDHPLLVRVVRVERPLLVARLDLVHARADELGVDVRADPGVLDPPTLAILRAIPLGVAVEIEDLHAASLREGRVIDHEEALTWTSPALPHGNRSESREPSGDGPHAGPPSSPLTQLSASSKRRRLRAASSRLKLH